MQRSLNTNLTTPAYLFCLSAKQINKTIRKWEIEERGNKQRLHKWREVEVSSKNFSVGLLDSTNYRYDLEKRKKKSIQVHLITKEYKKELQLRGSYLGAVFAASSLSRNFSFIVIRP